MPYSYNLESSITIIITIIAILITLLSQIYVNNSYKKYKRLKNKKGLTGFEVARQILDENGLNEILIVETKGTLSDHYDPTRKVIKLSTDIYNGTSIASLSVAAHEVGHAIQDKENYTFMKIRSIIFPIVNLSSKLGYFVILLGFLFNFIDLVYIGILLLAAILLFQLVTLPVELNASSRAMNNLSKHQFLENDELSSAKTMLTAAALTYVASLITTFLEILRLVILANRRRD